MGDVLELKRGYDLPKRDRVAGSVPVISSSGRTGSHCEAKVDPPGVVAGRYGTIGKVFYLDEAFWPLNTTLYVRDFKENDPRYIAYLLESLDLAGFVASAAVPGINRNHLHKLQVRVPDEAAQRRIAGVLAAFDDLIENNRRRIEILEEMARLIYREWFVHFRFPGHEDAELVDSDLGPTPTGWEVATVHDLAEIVRGRSYRRVELVEAPAGLPFLNLKCIGRGGGFRKSGLKRYDGRFKEEQLALPGDTVIAVTDMTQERNVVARAGRVPHLEEGRGVISLDLARVVPRGSVDGDFLYGMFRYSNFAEAVKEHANGTNVLHLSPDRIREFLTIVPPSQTQQSFREAVRPMYDLVENLQIQNEMLTEARDLLLPRLISGELDVSELDLPELDSDLDAKLDTVA